MGASDRLIDGACCTHPSPGSVVLTDSMMFWHAGSGIHVALSSGSVVLSVGRNACCTQLFSGSVVLSAGREYGPDSAERGKEIWASAVHGVASDRLRAPRILIWLCAPWVRKKAMGASGMESAMGTLGIEWDMCAPGTVSAMGASRMDWKRSVSCTQASSGRVVLSAENGYSICLACGRLGKFQVCLHVGAWHVFALGLWVIIWVRWEMLGWWHVGACHVFAFGWLVGM